MKSFIILAAFVAAASCFSIPSEHELMGHWQRFKAAHAKTYESAIEENFRVKIFKENAIKVSKHNERFYLGEVSFKVGINQFADMHTYEVVERLDGYRRDLKVQGGKVYNSSEVNAAPFPWPWNKDKVDWRSKGYVTEVKDEGLCSSSWSFSATGSLEGQLFKKTGKLVSLSVQNLIDCTRDYGNTGCGGGVVSSAFAYLKDNGGINTEESYPYEAQSKLCRFNESNIAGTATGFIVINSGSEEDLENALKKVGPVSVTIDASAWTFQAYESGIYYEPTCSSDQPNRGVLAVGYGSDGKNKDFWIVKNSWGARWGENGYIRMARNKENHCGIATEVIFPTVYVSG